MKRTNLLFMVLAASIIFFGCSKDDSLAPLNQNDQETTTLKKGNMKVHFTGKETPYTPGYDGDVTFLPNGKTLVKGITATWLDNTSDPLTSGLTDYDYNLMWEGAPFASSGRYSGKGKLSVMEVVEDVPQGEVLGTWDISFHGSVTLNLPEDPEVLPFFIFTAYGTGVGKTGSVKGMVSHLVYTLDTRDGMHYNLEGHYIDKK